MLPILPPLPPHLPSPAARRSGERSAAGGGKGCAPLSWALQHREGTSVRAREGAAGAAIGNRCDNGPNPFRASLHQDGDAASLPLVWLHLPPCCRHPFSSSSQLSLRLCMNLHLCLHTHNTRTPQCRSGHSENKQAHLFLKKGGENVLTSVLTEWLLLSLSFK